MAKTCNDVDFAAVRTQAKRMLSDAEKSITKGKFVHCVPQVESARTAFDVAAKTKGKLEQRNAYIRATFHAGQAHACAIVAGVGPRMKKPKKPKKAKA